MKTDLDSERLPFGKFATNSRLFLLAMLAFSILRILGQATLQMKNELSRKFNVQRRRLRSVIQDLIYIALHKINYSANIENQNNIMWKYIFNLIIVLIFIGSFSVDAQTESPNILPNKELKAIKIVDETLNKNKSKTFLSVSRKSKLIQESMVQNLPVKDGNALRWLNIAPLMPDYRNEIVADLIEMYKNGSITETAFSMALVPEGNPVIDKAKIFGKLFEDFRAGLSSCDMPTGILLQATIGHGWTPNSKAVFPLIVRQDGTSRYQFCPMSEAFQKYVFTSVRYLAKLRPAFFMVDDDFRLLTGRNGCYCKMHIAEFNRRSGKKYTRESLVAAIQKDTSVAREYDKLLQDSLVDLARKIRQAIDETDPSIQCDFCTCIDDIRHAPAIVDELSAKGTTSTIRINNARYLNDSLRSIPYSLLKTVIQIAGIPKKYRILAEPDTYPHNQHSTSATTMHVLLTYSILEGCRGGKLWITRTRTWEPTSGKKYREILSKYAGFYKTLATLDVKWTGAVSLLPSKPIFNFPVPAQGYYPKVIWATEVFAKMGIPFYFSKLPTGVVCLTGREIQMLPDETLRKLFRAKLLLDGTAAIELSKRGFSTKMGVNAQSWKLPPASLECLNNNKCFIISSATKLAELRPINNKVKILSKLYHKHSNISNKSQELSPGTTLYENKDGGKVVIVAIPVTTYKNMSVSFDMLNETRKSQLLNILGMLNRIPFYYLGTEEILLKCGKNKDDNILMMINIGLDDVSPIKLGHDSVTINTVEMLCPDGSWQNLNFEQKNKQLVVKHELRPQQPAILRIKN
ncbi:MAG: hypothetical protein JXR78_15005 [Victivallales bacterium]|nr:hypothetical protein [Victivallales bacterium]